jgi:hypothetical protein
LELEYVKTKENESILLQLVENMLKQKKMRVYYCNSLRIAQKSQGLTGRLRTFVE